MRPPPIAREPDPQAARWLLQEARISLAWHEGQALVCLTYGLEALGRGQVRTGARDLRWAAWHAAKAARLGVAIALLKRAAGPNIPTEPTGVRITVHPDGAERLKEPPGGRHDGDGEA